MKLRAPVPGSEPQPRLSVYATHPPASTWLVGAALRVYPVFVLVAPGSAMIVSLGSTGHVRALLFCKSQQHAACKLMLLRAPRTTPNLSAISANVCMKLNKAKRAARARALRGRAARKPAAPRRPAPTTARRPAPTTPRRPAPPGPVSTPRRPPPVGSAMIPPLAVRAAGAVPPGTAACPYKPCSSVPPVAVVYARRLVAALVAEDERAASRLRPVVRALLEEDVVEEEE
ncbi:uncharacterized protein BDR25DRAFT_397537, partial [Lindgomyces ingoldianus]